uniref:Uncharacterized protein n=1 Tax=Mycena chlorophos TaxID=658473 RepID=A0ABQ0LWN5_MYCCL|nr:predicted protein [Mycena chlorophos]
MRRGGYERPRGVSLLGIQHACRSQRQLRHRGIRLRNRLSLGLGRQLQAQRLSRHVWSLQIVAHGERVAGEDLVGAFAGKHDLEPRLANGFGQQRLARCVQDTRRVLVMPGRFIQRLNEELFGGGNLDELGAKIGGGVFSKLNCRRKHKPRYDNVNAINGKRDVGAQAEANNLDHELASLRDHRVDGLGRPKPALGGTNPLGSVQGLGTDVHRRKEFDRPAWRHGKRAVSIRTLGTPSSRSRTGSHRCGGSRAVSHRKARRHTHPEDVRAAERRAPSPTWS